MKQLSSLDATFLALENDRNYGHTGGLAILDPSGAPGGEITIDDIKQLLADRIHLIPPFTSKLVPVPLNLDRPYWVTDDNFDLNYHCRELALPKPGSMDQLAEQAARVYSRHLDRSRPLWELYLIQGLPDGRVAMLTKIHHSSVDGMSGQEIMTILYDLTPDARDVDPPSNDPDYDYPSASEMLGHWITGMPRYPVNAVTRLARVLPHVDVVPSAMGIPGTETISRALSRARRFGNRDPETKIIQRSQVKAPRGPYGKKVSPHRKFGFASLSLSDVKSVKNQFAVTVNDVVVSIAAGAIRGHLAQHGELPEEPLVAMIPVSVRTEEERGSFGNEVSVMMAPISTHLEDPADRIRFQNETLRTAKEQHEALPAKALRDVTTFIPPALHARATRAITELNGAVTRPALNVIISNVPGPPIDIYSAGARLEALYPLSIITDGSGLNVTVMSYRDSIDIGITADREMTPDVQSIADGMVAELEILVDAAPG
ncbi:MAG: wax ester/triacylglycerol synthase family O-acyltransferase [Solirubrobacterales bacterium]